MNRVDGYYCNNLFSVEEYLTRISPSILGGNIRNDFMRKCNDIEEKLRENGLRVNVSRHTCFDTKYYVIEEENSNVCIDKNTIADVLDIPKDWVDFVSITKLISTYWIKEDELNEKYWNGKTGHMEFDDDWCLFNSCNKLRTHREIEKRLNDKGLSRMGGATVLQEKNLLLIFNTSFNDKCHAKALNIPINAVTDVSCSHLESDLAHGRCNMIVDLDKVKGE